MSADRIERAVQRIETALGRIANAADTRSAAPPSISALVVKHETLREATKSTLAKLDKLIEDLDQ